MVIERRSAKGSTRKKIKKQVRRPTRKKQSQREVY